MDKNFLPEARLYSTGGEKSTINCIVRGKNVVCTPEERVRQRVLKWLVNDRNWPSEQITVERPHSWVGDKNRTRIRSDIELFDVNCETQLVVECKAKHIYLTDIDVSQAREYAMKSKAKRIWITNGEEHIFQVKEGRRWQTVDSLDVLKVKYKGQPILPNFPKKLTTRNVNNYLSKRGKAGDTDFSEYSKQIKDIVMAFNKLVFHTKFILPCSNDNFHILQDCGTRFLNVTNPVGNWNGWYRGFVVSTLGGTQSCWLHISFMSDDYYTDDLQGLKAFVCVQTNQGLRQRIQLTMNETNCESHETQKYWEICHNGSMSKVSIKKVMESIRESGADHLIDTYDGKEWVCLGKLHSADTCTWRNSKNFLTNFLHYGFIRNNLALSEFSKKSKS